MSGVPPPPQSFVGVNPQTQTQNQSFGYTVGDGRGGGGTEMVSSSSSSSLLVKHLPEAIPLDTLSRLFFHFGASSVRPCSSGRLRNCAFVDFKDEVMASQAQGRLNGLRFLGKVLSVQKASRPLDDSKGQQSETSLRKDFDSSKSLIKETAAIRDQSETSKSRPLPTGEPIAPTLGVDFPFPPHLEYAYPPPDGNILTNIVNALIAVPRFYTQVLHLMNKMNIPAPFRMALPTPPLPPPLAAPSPPPPPPIEKPHLADLSSDESELESSDEEVDKKTSSLGTSGQSKPGRKRARREAIVGPAADKDVVHEAVGLKPATLLPKEVPLIKKKNSVLQIKIGPKQVISEPNDSNTVENFEEPMSESSESKLYATPEEIQNGKLPPEEILSLPKFKNYTAGNPAPVLYIKNLAKDVVADDFLFIFGSFFGSLDAAKSSLTIKLMQEGRMKGQAFVTFPSVDLAHQALNLVNGYVFKGKPTIIQFGRNPAAAKS